MRWFERVRRWLRRDRVKSAAPPCRQTGRDEEDDEIAELLAIEII